MRVLAFLLLALPASADPITKAGDIIKNRDAMDGRSVCAVGKLTFVEQRFGTVTGKHLFRGKLDDGTGVLYVFNYGHLPRTEVGERIQACGRYVKTYVSPSKNVYQNQITASVFLKGRGVEAGLVDIVGDRVVPLGKGSVAAQSTRPPGPPSP